ncbi:MAG: SnoaL-like domain [Deltaproteobacteria bacterium]|nr:SnoaL-like domain [Deltaproteobacteria bacterium]
MAERTHVPPDPPSVVAEYFARIRARDIGVVDLFHDDASVIGLGARRTGRDAILELYRDVFNRVGPVPREAAPVLSAGSRVAAEIYIDRPGDSTVHAVDLFEVSEGRIRSLTYFLADYPQGD